MAFHPILGASSWLHAAALFVPDDDNVLGVVEEHGKARLVEPS
jgi:hypothetical protein